MKAAEALVAIAEHHAADTAFAGRKPEKRFYRCAHCAWWHLTSKGSDRG